MYPPAPADDQNPADEKAPPNARRPQVAEVRALRARPLELVEARDRGDHEGAVPELRGLLALGGRGDDRAEEGDLPAVGSGDRDDRRADLLADLLDALVVGGAQLGLV